jgi:peptide/nickel transport system substrate-binding protein
MDKAEETLDPNQARDVINQADAQVWNEVHSLVLYQRPQQTAVKSNLVNVGSFGFEQPDYTKIGFASNPS